MTRFLLLTAALLTFLATGCGDHADFAAAIRAARPAVRPTPREMPRKPPAPHRPADHGWGTL